MRLDLVSGLLPMLVSITFTPFAFHILVFFHSLFFTCHWTSFMFLLYDQCICTHSIDSSLTQCLGQFPGLGLALAWWYPMLWSQSRGAHEAEISFQISALAGV